MNKIHYYFGWFNGSIPKEITQALHKDIFNKKSLVTITTAPSDYKHTDEMNAFTKDTWFEPAGMVFDNYHSIDYRIKKEGAHELLKNASAILLHGGYADQLKFFLEEYEMATAIKESNAVVVMGASAGGMNMCAKFVSSKYIDDNTRGPGTLYNGLGLDNFALQSHAVCTIETLAKQNHTINHLIPLSQDINVYVACEESTIRTKNGILEVMGDVYLISKSQIEKVEESELK